MKISNYVTDPAVRERWNTLTEEQQAQLNDAFKRGQIAKSNLQKYIDSAKPPAVIRNERQRRLWHKMTPEARQRALLHIEGLAMIGANAAGALTGELQTDN